jgi:hypothetical protein
MPRLHDETNSKAVLPPTRTQYAVLKKWEAGNFVNDWGQPQPPELPPDALDRMNLQSCSGGAFFPGIEAGAIMKQVNNYVEPFRLDATVLQPGQITQGNALPWQADFYACAWEPQSFIGWWPDHVRTSLGSDETEDWDRGINNYEGMVANWHRLGVVVPKQDASGGTIFVEDEWQQIP